MKLAPRYVTDETGARTEVILSIKDYEALLEDLADLGAIADRKAEPTISHSDFVEELKKDGLISN
ncbi:MAG: hypothetical protein ACSHX7_09110 [Luteolibacter sp.]